MNHHKAAAADTGGHLTLDSRHGVLSCIPYIFAAQTCDIW
jgi:hypothetical protein